MEGRSPSKRVRNIRLRRRVNKLFVGGSYSNWNVSFKVERAYGIVKTKMGAADAAPELRKVARGNRFGR